MCHTADEYDVWYLATIHNNAVRHTIVSVVPVNLQVFFAGNLLRLWIVSSKSGQELFRMLSSAGCLVIEERYRWTVASRPVEPHSGLGGCRTAGFT